MKRYPSLKPGIWGAVIGAIGISVVGFSSLGWTLGGTAEGTNHAPAPGHTAAGAARLWTTSLNCSGCQTDWKDRMVTGDGAGRDLPNIARILAQRVPHAAFGFEDVKSDDGVAVRPPPSL